MKIRTEETQAAQALVEELRNRGIPVGVWPKYLLAAKMFDGLDDPNISDCVDIITEHLQKMEKTYPGIIGNADQKG